MPIFDWYLLLTPLFAVSIVLTVLAIKQSIKNRHQPDIETLAKAKQEQNVRNQIQRSKNRSQSTQIESVKPQNTQLKKTFSYFMRNHSFLEICMTRTAKNKLPMLLSFSIISILCFIFPSMYIYSLVGIFIVFIFVLVESFFEVDPVDSMATQQQQFNLQAVKKATMQQQRMQERNKILYIVFGTVSCAISLLVCGLIYRNYLNSVLSVLFTNLAVNFALDLFLVRPIGFLILSFPLKFNLRIQTHIEHENLRQQFAEISLSINTQNCAVNSFSPKKKKNIGSPTKVPRAISKFQQDNDSQNFGISSAMENLKRIKRQKRGSQLMTPFSKRNQIQDETSGMGVEQYTLKNLLQKEGSNLNTPVNRFNFENNDDNQQFSSAKGEKKRKDSQLVIVEFKNNERSKQKQQEDVVEEESPNKNFIHTNLDMDDVPEYMNRNKSFGGQQRSENGGSRDGGQINVIKLMNVNKDGEYDEEYGSRKDRRDSFMTLQNKNRLISINENGQDRQIEQIDLNSPQKRRNQLQTIIQDASQDPKSRKKAKHFQSSAKKRVIKFTSGQPYLEYLPKMLTKEQNKHTKRSQPITYKNDIQNYNERPRKSLNKIKAPRHESVLFGGGNENECPEAIEIEDL